MKLDIRTSMKICQEKQNLVKMGNNIEESLITKQVISSYLTEVNESIVFRDITGFSPENRTKCINALCGQTA